MLTKGLSEQILTDASELDPKPNFFRLTGWLEQNYGCFLAELKKSATQYLWLKMPEYGYFSAKEYPNVVIVKHCEIQHAVFNVLFCFE